MCSGQLVEVHIESNQPELASESSSIKVRMIWFGFMLASSV